MLKPKLSMGNFTSKAVSAPLLQPAIAGDGLKIKQLIGHFIAASSPKSKEETKCVAG